MAGEQAQRLESKHTTMPGKIDSQLQTRLDEAASQDPQREIPVVITLKVGADVTALERTGMKVQRAFEAIPAVAGTVTASQARQLAQLDQVELIEADTEAHAL